ncbi:Hypothetical predicted protein, partial [Pelobates cultripes]
KAFDLLLWPYLYSVLRHLGFPNKFLSVLAALYKRPTGQLLLPNMEAQTFMIANIHDCPLSPLLFAISLEPLLQAIRRHPDIQGVQIRQETYKCGRRPTDPSRPHTIATHYADTDQRLY